MATWVVVALPAAAQAPLPPQPSVTEERGPSATGAGGSTTSRGPRYPSTPPSSYGYGGPYGGQGYQTPQGSQSAPGYQQPQQVHYIPFYPDTLPYREGQTIPPGYVVQSRSNVGLAVGGAVTFILSYGFAVGGGAATGFERGTTWLAAPVVGPWAAIAARDFECDITVADRQCIERALDDAAVVSVFVFNGIVQATGFTMMIVGAASKRKQLVRKDRITLSPTLDPNTAGLRIDGTF